MATLKKLLILEFNELSPTLMQQFIDEGHLPAFAELQNRSNTYTTIARDTDLQPWVQWVTFHTGRGQTEHQIEHLDEGHLVEVPQLWDFLADHGLSSFVFSAMNGNTSRPAQVALVPDPWASRVELTIPHLERIHKFGRGTVQEHASPGSGVGGLSLVPSMWSFMRNGLRAKTIARLAGQVLSEKVRRRNRRWRRACLFDQMMWDVFARTWHDSPSEVGVFFANSTAFLQHRYWRHLEPEQFVVPPSDDNDQELHTAILEGYRMMDSIVARVLDDDRLGSCSVVLATALSQHANPDRRETPPENAFRPIDFAGFLEFAGVKDVETVEPLMTHWAWATFASEAQAEDAATKLGQLTCDGAPAVEMERRDRRLRFACGIRVVDEDSLLRSSSGQSMRFAEMFAQVGSSILDGSHAPEGILWIKPASAEEAVADKGAVALEAAARIITDQLHLASSTEFGLRP